MDLQWEFIEGNIAAPEIRDYMSALAADGLHRTCTFAVCFNNPQKTIATALYLPETVLKRALQVLVYQKNTFDIIEKVATSEKGWKRYEKLKPFGIMEGCYLGDVFNNKLAKFANLLYLGESFQPDNGLKGFAMYNYRADHKWEELGIVNRLSNIDLVDSFGLKLRSAGNNREEQASALADENKMENFAMAEHLRWLTERLTMGYKPLEEHELNLYKIARDSGKYEHSKDYYKEKARAHIDICPDKLFEDRDPQTYYKGTDKKMIKMMATLQRCQQIDQLIRFTTLSPKENPLSGFVHDMERISSFWMGKHPVTVEQWKAVMGSSPKECKGSNKKEYVTHVSLEEINDFLHILQKETGLPFDLPTQEQWEEAFKVQGLLVDMEGVIWQWTKTHDNKYKSSYRFCGRSRKFEKMHWDKDRNNSSRLPNFKSSDLGFRLVLPYDFDTIKKDMIELYNTKDDDDKVIKELLNSMVEIKGNDDNKILFKISPTPITQRQWIAVMRYYGNKKKNPNPSINKGDYNPVEYVSFKDAQDFVELLNKYVEGRKFRLPQKNEWLYVANLDITDKDLIWYSKYEKTTKSVRRTPQKGFQIIDMYGNVWEWCEDWYDDSRITHILMGGSWRFSKDECLEQTGSYWLPDYKADDVGFRIVEDI